MSEQDQKSQDVQEQQEASAGTAQVNDAPVDYEAEARKWKELSRKNEARAKENAEKASKFDELEEQSKSELQKAIEAREAAEKRASALEVKALRASLGAKHGVDPALITGESEDEITASIEALLEWRGSTASEKTPAATSSGDAGPRGGGIDGVEQLSRDDLKNMTSAEIVQARKDGKLRDLMNR